MAAPLRHDLICFSHTRWEVPYQRPQHLLSRAARDRRVFFIEDPIFERCVPHLSKRRTAEGVLIVRPVLPRGTPPGEVSVARRELVGQLIDQLDIANYLLWFSTPLALPFAHHLGPAGVVYDCLEELPGLRSGVPTQLELRLLGAADLVFTGTDRECAALREHHANVHAFPGLSTAWDQTWAEMAILVDDAIAARAALQAELEPRRARSAAAG